MKFILVYILVYTIIAFIWMAYEFLFVGEVKSDLFDSIIAMILAFYITNNIVN